MKTKIRYLTRTSALNAKMNRMRKLRAELDSYKNDTLLTDNADAMAKLTSVRIDQIDEDVDRRSLWKKSSIS